MRSPSVTDVRYAKRTAKRKHPINARRHSPGDFFINLTVLDGGRDRTRTCDLLRVKNSGSFYPFYLLLWLSTIWGVCFRSADIS